MLFATKPVPQIIATKEAVRKGKGRKGKLRLRKPPRQRQPLKVEREQRGRMFKMLDQARELLEQRLLPRLPEIERAAEVRSDRQDIEEWPDTVARIMADIRAIFAEVENTARPIAQQSAAEVSAFNRARVTSQMRAALGVDIFVSDPKLGAALAASVTENAGLIKSVPARFLDEVEQTIMRQFRTGQRASDVAAEISERFQVSRKRAAFIARDQVSKLNGDLTRQRQSELGIPGYIWRTSDDERVRPGHAKLDGKPFRWGNPPVVDEKTGRRAHPGGDFNCRCTAEPDLESLVEDISGGPTASVSSAAVATEA